MFIYPDSDIGIQFVTKYIKLLKKIHKESQTNIDETIEKTEPSDKPETKKEGYIARSRRNFTLKPRS